MRYHVTFLRFRVLALRGYNWMLQNKGTPSVNAVAPVYITGTNFGGKMTKERHDHLV